jgi:hypothetical protein
MEATTNYLQERRKMALLLPVPVVPCLLLLFYGLGGGGGATGATATGVVQGVNMSLPMAQLDSKKTPDKLQLYDKAAADSAKLLEKQKQDPYALKLSAADTLQSRVGAGWHGLQLGLDQRQRTADVMADQVMARVESLKNALGSAATGGWAGQQRGADRGEMNWQGEPGAGERWAGPSTGVQDRAISRRDPEMERIDGMLDKLIRIQHPELVSLDSGRRSSAGRVMVLTVPRQEEVVRGLERGVAGVEETVQRQERGVPGAEETTGFMEIGDGSRPDSVRHSVDEALEAVIADDQTVMSGSTVALRLTHAGSLDGIPVPAGQLVYGEASIGGERLKLHIAAVRVGSLILPVDIQVYDLDGIAGIRVPGAMTRDVSKESASEAMSGLGLASMDPSLTGQAANAGLQLAKSLTSRKLRAVRVAVPAGYRVLLRNVKNGL